MDSRYSFNENARAAALTYLPAGSTIVVPDNDLGDGGWVAANIKPKRLEPPARPGIPVEAIVPTVEAAAKSMGPNSIVPLFDGVPNADPRFMNQWVMSKRKTFLPPEQFNVYQPYPEPPVTWQPISGVPSRFDGR